MEAGIGDRVAVVVPDGSETYLVEWADDGHRQLVQLSPGSHLEKRD